MNGKIARGLRKAANFKPKDKREYETWTIGVKQGRIYRFKPVTETEEAGVEIIDKEVDCFVTECVTPERKIYQGLKKQYQTFKDTGTVSLNFNELPDAQSMEKLREQAIKEVTDE